GRHTTDTLTLSAATEAGASSEPARGITSELIVALSSVAGWPDTIFAIPIPDVTINGHCDDDRGVIKAFGSVVAGCSV
ncbi:MAG: hypothetical protein J2P48_20860, partial [Alphaproteobacteria bacterium]|nr:hypothetical protein [Alphaproteobacteria bacterium]